MRITLVQIHLTGGAPVDSYHVQVFGLARRLAGMGCDVTVISSDHGVGDREETRDGYRVIYLPVKSRVMHQTLVSGLTHAIERTAPDVVQVAELVELTTIQTVLWCRRHGIPCVVWHGAYQFHGKAVPVQKLYLGTLGRMLCRMADAFVAKTRSAKAFLEGLGADGKKVHAIPVGLDTDWFLRGLETPCDLPWIPDQPFLMNVGQMVPRKNQALLVRALEAICSCAPEFRLLLVGSGPEEGPLRDLASALGLEDRVVLQTERVPNPMLAHAYSRAFATVMPSEYEIFGMAVLESYACGTPAIGRRTGGMADIVQHGVTGWLFDDNDRDAICRAVLDAYRDPVSSSALRSQAREASACYDWAALAPRFLEVYRAAASGYTSHQP